jgi:hypothetical protein
MLIHLRNFSVDNVMHHPMKRYAVAQLVAGSIPVGVTESFSFTQPFQPHRGPGVVSASSRNEYQEYFLRERVKAAGA